MTKKIDIWAIVADLGKDKTNLIRNSEAPHKEWAKYNSNIVNRHFALFQDTIMIASQVNRIWEMPVDMQHDYYFYEVRPKSRFTKWPKKSKEDMIAIVSEVYNINRKKAVETLDLLSDEQLNEIKRLHNRGGKE